jgi:hypothetical protein
MEYCIANPWTFLTPLCSMAFVTVTSQRPGVTQEHNRLFLCDWRWCCFLDVETTVCGGTSTAEAEYVAACEAAMEAVASSNILQEVLPQKTVELKIDNQAAHVLATNPTYSRRTRHIELRWHFVREQVEKGILDLHKVSGANNPADAFTKPLDKHRLMQLLMTVGTGGDNCVETATLEFKAAALRVACWIAFRRPANSEVEGPIWD